MKNDPIPDKQNLDIYTFPRVLYKDGNPELIDQLKEQPNIQVLDMQTSIDDLINTITQNAGIKYHMFYYDLTETEQETLILKTLAETKNAADIKIYVVENVESLFEQDLSDEDYGKYINFFIGLRASYITPGIILQSQSSAADLNQHWKFIRDNNGAELLSLKDQLKAHISHTFNYFV